MQVIDLRLRAAHAAICANDHLPAAALPKLLDNHDTGGLHNFRSASEIAWEHIHDGEFSSVLNLHGGSVIPEGALHGPLRAIDRYRATHHRFRGINSGGVRDPHRP